VLDFEVSAYRWILKFSALGRFVIGKPRRGSDTLSFMNLPLNFFKSDSDAQLIQELKAMKLFKSLTSRELREVEQLLHERKYEKDEIIFDEGDPGLGLFIVVNGRVRASSSIASFKNLAAEFCCGDFFGELSLFDEGPRTARITAAEPADIVALFRTEFFSLLEGNRNIAAKILFEISQTVCRRSRRMLLNEKDLPII
jgi:CRP-like cAMP-binding protein